MKKALVIGGARSGKYISLLLAENDYAVTLTDINQVPYKAELEAVGIEVVEGLHPDSLLDVKYDLVIKNPGIKYDSPFIVKVLEAGYKIYNEIDVALRYVPNADVLAITGTNGKTTTVTLACQMLKQDYSDVYLCGNIGIPVSEIVYKHPDAKVLVIELSSFQLDGIYDMKPKIANITNLQNDHLDYYADLDSYFKSKQAIYQNQDDQDIFIRNIDDQLVVDYFKNDKVKTIDYGIDNPSAINFIDDKVIYQDVELFNKRDLKIVGKHNLYNALVAAIMSFEYGVKPASISKVISTFKGVEHRIEFVDTIAGVAYYNDSKATNVESVKVALTAFEKPVILIAGGYDKQISFADLSNYQAQVKLAILFGETKDKLKDVFDQAIIVDSLEIAVNLASQMATTGDTVLFSPACASFDQFKDYEERGQIFKNLVKNIKA